MTTNEYMDDITRQALTELAGQLSDDLGGRLQERVAGALDARGEALDARIGQRLEGDLNQFRQAWEERFARLVQDLDQHLKAGEDSRAAALAGLTNAGKEVRAAADQTRTDMAAVQERMAQTEDRLHGIAADQVARIDALSQQTQADADALRSIAAQVDALTAREATRDGALQGMRDDASRTEGKVDHLLADIQEARKSMADGIASLIGNRFEDMGQTLNASTARTVSELAGRLSDLQSALTGAMEQNRRQLDAAVSQSAAAQTDGLRTVADELRDRFESTAQEIADGLEVIDRTRQKALSVALAEQEKTLSTSLNRAADQRSVQIVDRLNEKADGRASAIQASLEGLQARLDALEVSWKKDNERLHKAIVEQQETNSAMERQMGRLGMQNMAIMGLFAVMAIAFIVGLFR